MSTAKPTSHDYAFAMNEALSGRAGIAAPVISAIDELLGKHGENATFSLRQLREILASEDRAYLAWGAPPPKDLVVHLANALSAATQF